MEKEKSGDLDQLEALNQDLIEELSIEELEKRLELDAPKTCGQYTTSPGA